MGVGFDIVAVFRNKLSDLSFLMSFCKAYIDGLPVVKF